MIYLLRVQTEIRRSHRDSAGDGTSQRGDGSTNIPNYIDPVSLFILCLGKGLCEPAAPAMASESQPVSFSAEFFKVDRNNGDMRNWY